jgi:HSP20 family protein
MTLVYQGTRNPFHQIRHEMDRLLTGFLGQPAEDFLPAALRGRPPVNIWELNDALKVEMELPGVAKEQIDISVAGGELSIKIDRPENAPDDSIYHRRERSFGVMTRVLRLPVEVNADRVEASLRDGVLTVTLPKAESAKPRKINVATGQG